ncbi:NAD-dependent epimerase/dehydratase family protein [Microbacterium sp. VKM Ac-2870]|uniref:NAD-dependent epimerase/dehydratase family protein n=1 Tax=Microbacterium sp. VKM Ac-2870 TaxID=2783825 RepID=UPI00188BDE50|nr:NAD-dependent epimerase/dehydratase family protein [Microbacterium sp. VKM Ac-2870]MBF4561943.1 NAD-dependent epimerase/dehydratase family protein [Microbacterium sp. VKM Ac-2870]
MTDVLVLGGSGWLSSRIAEKWRDAGAAVTCLTRGSRPSPHGVRHIVGDRDDEAAYEAVRDRSWDEVVDISSRASHVRAAVAALGERAGHLTYVSSVSAYADDDDPGADESAPLAVPAEPGDPYDYRREKSAAEAAVRAGLVGRAAVVRPGLIVGAGDPTDRFGYWAARFAAAGSGPVLVPDAPDAAAQVIDIDDLAAFVVSCGQSTATGAVNAVGDSLPLRAMLEAARAVAGHTGEPVAAPPRWLREHGVEYWAGPRSLPLWLPDDVPGFARRSHARYRAEGGQLAPLVATIERVLADERARGLERARAAGLRRADELALIADLA